MYKITWNNSKQNETKRKSKDRLKKIEDFFIKNKEKVSGNDILLDEEFDFNEVGSSFVVQGGKGEMEFIEIYENRSGRVTKDSLILQ